MAYKSKYTGKQVDELLTRIEEGSCGSCIETSYADLKTLRDESKLIVGAFYRITDYECTTMQAGSRSANHPFDIIVQALDERTLSENAQAIQRDGDEYFANCNLNAWKLKYALDNDTSRFAWAKEEIKEQPAKWSCSWGVLEERYDNGASTNYEETTIDEVQKYLYRPTQPTSYLEGKTFYRYDGKETLSFEDASDLYFVTRENPFIIGEQYSPMLVIYAPTGRVIAEIEVESDSGEIDYEENIIWNTIFIDGLDMKTYGNTIDINGEVYYTWEHWDDPAVLDNWAIDNSPFVINEGTKIVYEGSTDSLYYALDSIVGKYDRSVYEVTDGNHIYKYENEEDGEDALLDTISYTNYIEQQEGGKGVIYRMIDEHNNNYPFDFKNMQFSHNGKWYYAFSFDDKDLSLTDYCYNNYLSDNKQSVWDDTTTPVAVQLPMLILNARPNRQGKTAGIMNCNLESSVNSGYVCATRIDGFEWKPILGGKWAIVNNIYINLSSAFMSNSISGQCDKFEVGTEDAPASLFNYNEINLSTEVAKHFTCKANTFVNNKLDLAEGSAGFVITTGSMTSCNITNTFYENFWYADKIEFGVNAVMRDCVIKIYNALTINYANTTSTTEPLRFLNIDARGWDDSTITIPATFPKNASYELKVAKNSNGEIKMWCDADLIQ